MKNYRIIISLLLWSMVSFSQSKTGVNARTENEEVDLLKTTLPDVIPPSPDAFSFTEYGKNTVNEYKGKLSTSIPLYNYAAGQLNTAISLGYSGAGVKVEDMATWVGINWNLSAGGVITRQIKDGVDEGVTVRPVIDEAHMKTNADSLCAPYSQYYWSMAYYNRDYNTEVDIFNYNFDGYSGSFYLDANFNPVNILNENEVKIEIIGTGSTNKAKLLNDYTFMITTPTGVKYYFGSSAKESTRVVSGAPSLDTDGITSFYLYKIEHPVNGTILFEYDTVAMKRQDLSKSYSMTTAINAYGPNVLGQFNKNIYSTRINDLKRLKKIKSLNNTIEVVFNRTDYDNYNFTSVLNSISVVNTSGQPTLLKKINFTYGAKLSPTGTENDFANISRFFLTKLEIDKDLDSTGHKSESYTFDYDDPYSLPNRIQSPGNLDIDPSNSRDFAGYYNGKPNRSLIANDPRYFNFNSTLYFADLSPDFSKGKKGSLVKITYPTKGYSIFEYEPSPAKKTVHKRYTFHVNSYIDNINEYPYVMECPGFNPLLNDFVARPNVYEDQYIKFKISLKASEHTNSTFLQNKGAQFIIQDVTANTTQTFTQLFSELSPVRMVELKKDHVYNFKLQLKDNYVSDDEAVIEAGLDFNVFEGYTAIEGMGIRLKSEKNYNHDHVKTHENRYYYGTINGGYNDFSKVPDLQLYPKISYTYALGTEQQGLINANLSSEFLNKYNTVMDEPENYPVVSISFGGDNFEKGGIEKTFLHVRNTDVKRLTTAHDGCWEDFVNGNPTVVCWEDRIPKYTFMEFVIDDYKTYQKNEQSQFNGKLLTERHYVKKDGVLFKIKEQETQYKIEKDFSKKITNFLGNKIIGQYVTGMNFCFSDPNDYNSTRTILNGLYGIYFGYYYTYVFNQKLDKTITTEYVDPVPMSSYIQYNQRPQVNFTYDNPDLIIGDPDGYIPQSQIEASFKKIVTTQSYEYGTLRGLPTKVSMVMSDGTAQNSESIYVNQYETLSGLTTDQKAAYALMLAQNNVASPIEVKQSDNSETLTKKRTTYKKLSVTNTKVVPEKIYTAKGTQLIEDRATFEEYDSKGNPTLMSLTGGVKIKYLYNAYNQVIAKIENFTGTLDPNTNSIANPLTFIGQYPNAQVSVFEYEPVTNLLLRMYDPNGKKTTYVYDSMHRLQQIKDNEDNVVKEFDQNFKH